MKDNSTNKQRLSVLFSSVFSTASVETPSLREISPLLDNDLPATVLRFGASNDNGIVCSCHLDSCTAMNTGNTLLYMWIMIKYPDIVISYERYDDSYVFQPITLD